MAMTANPSTLTLLARLGDQHKESLIRDVADGFASEGYLAIAPALFDRFDRACGVDDERVREIQAEGRSPEEETQ